MCGFRHACKRASEFSVKRLCVYLAFGLQLGQAERDNEEYILANKFSTECSLVKTRESLSTDDQTDIEIHGLRFLHDLK